MSSTLEEGNDPHVVYHQGEMGGHEEEWLDEIADMDEMEMDEVQKIYKACAAGDLDAVKALYNGNRIFRTRKGLSFGLSGAVMKQHLDIIKFCLERGAVVDEEIAGDTVTIGIDAIPILELFLEYGWDINWSPGGHGDNPLALVLDNRELLWLLDHGSNPNIESPPRPDARIRYITNNGGVLDIAADKCDIELVDLLLRYGARIEYSLGLHIMAMRQHPDGRQITMMKDLLDVGADVNASDQGKIRNSVGTPLTYAIGAKRIGNVRFLLENGADPQIKDGRGRTALEHGKEKGDPEILALIQDALDTRKEMGQGDEQERGNEVVGVTGTVQSLDLH